MKLLARSFCFVVLLCCMLAAPVAVRADLNSDVQTVLQDKLLHKASVGIEVVRLGRSAADVKHVFSLESTTPLMPASNLKLATTSAALDRFGPDFRFRTILLMRGQDLVVIGGGDPTFGDLEYLKKAGWGITTVFQNWTEQLKKLNVTSVRDVVVDDSVFDESFTHPRWPAGQYTARFEAGVAGLNLNANCIECIVEPTAPGALVKYTLDPPTQYVSIHNACVTGNRNGIILTRPPESNQLAMSGETPSRGLATVGITVHDPPMYAANVFADVLRRGGIHVSGEVKRDRTARQTLEKGGISPAEKATIVAIHETPIQPVLARANKDSMNLYAESLCKRLGFETSHAPGSWENGTAAVGAFLKKAGVTDREFHLDDGSGLSRGNTISPRALTQVLVYDYYSKNKETFFNSLSIAGVDGTLDDRFRANDLRDLRHRVFGKSGFIEGVSTISGYLHARDDQWYAFSIMLNGIPHLSNSEIKVLQERIVRAVDNTTQSASARRAERHASSRG